MLHRRDLRLLAASVWLHQGLWCKVLGRRPDHVAIVAAVPGVGSERARALTRGLGVAETALAALVIRHGDRRPVAAAQLGLVAAMNAGGLVAGRRHIDRPARLVARNAAFGALVWGATGGR